jgi:hypothetical protein
MEIQIHPYCTHCEVYEKKMEFFIVVFKTVSHFSRKKPFSYVACITSGLSEAKAIMPA